MGGFGALRNGFRYADTFSHIAGLSSALNMFETPCDDPARCVIYEDTVFGDLKKAELTDKNPRVALTRFKQEMEKDPRLEMPKVYMAIGTEDRLLESNRRMREYLVSEGVDVTYSETPGNHNWDFWGAQIREVLEWLPLGKSTAGINSGNVPGA